MRAIHPRPRAGFLAVLVGGFVCVILQDGYNVSYLSSEGSTPRNEREGIARHLNGPHVPTDVKGLSKSLKADLKKQAQLDALHKKYRSEVQALLSELEASRKKDIQRMCRLRERLRSLPRTVQELEFDNHVEMSRLCGLLGDLGYEPPAEAAAARHALEPLPSSAVAATPTLGDTTTHPAPSLFVSQRPSRQVSPSPRGRSSPPLSHGSARTPEPHTPHESPTPLRGVSQLTRGSRTSPSAHNQNMKLLSGQRSPIVPHFPVDAEAGAPVEAYRELLRTEVDGWQSEYELARIQGSQRFDRDITRALREIRMKKEEAMRELDYKFRARLRESCVELDKEVLHSRQEEFRRKINVQCDIAENDISSEHQNLKLGYLNEIGDHWHDTDIQLRSICDEFRTSLSAITTAAEGQRNEIGHKLRDGHDKCIKNLVDKYLDELTYQYRSGTKKPKLGSR
ncbi:hypothetical protein AAMO2058_001664500 [Amorphochlora amoebiformis]